MNYEALYQKSCVTLQCPQIMSESEENISSSANIQERIILSKFPWLGWHFTLVKRNLILFPNLTFLVKKSNTLMVINSFEFLPVLYCFFNHPII